MLPNQRPAAPQRSLSTISARLRHMACCRGAVEAALAGNSSKTTSKPTFEDDIMVGPTPGSTPGPTQRSRNQPDTTSTATTETASDATDDMTFRASDQSPR